MRRPRHAAALLIACAIGVGAAYAQEPRDAQGSAKRVLGDGGFQTWLPGDEEPSGKKASDTRRDSSTTPPAKDSPYDPPTSYDDSHSSTYVGWGLAIVGAGIALLWIVQEVRAARFRGMPAIATSAPAPAAPTDAATTRETASPSIRSVDAGALARARALADAGRREEAVHELLLAAIAALADVGRAPADAALTSREVLEASRLVDEHRGALHALVDAVEASRFGGGEVGVDDFERCASAFGALERAGSAR